jgi:hypothetical protein
MEPKRKCRGDDEAKTICEVTRVDENIMIKKSCAVV